MIIYVDVNHGKYTGKFVSLMSQDDLAEDACHVNQNIFGAY